MYLSIIVPAYNEEKRLPRTLVKIDQYLQNQPYDYEIIVINDGSKDATAQKVKRLEPEIKNLRLIDNKENHGKGFVVRQAMLAAKGEYRLFTDADNSTPINQIEKLLPFFKEDYDIVIGSRDMKGAEIINPQSSFRIFLGNGFNLLVQIIIGLWGVWDSQCGFKAMTAKAVKDIIPRCQVDRWSFDPEILIIGKRLDYKIKEVPVVWINDPDSRVKLRGTIKMAIDLLKIRWNLITKKYDL